MDRPPLWHNLRQFQNGNVIQSVFDNFECDFCGESVMGSEEDTINYVNELIESSGPLSASEIINIATFDLHNGCCSRCSHFLDSD